MKPFQITILLIFLGLALGAVLVFSTYSGIFNESAGKVIVWGAQSSSVINGLIDEVDSQNRGVFGQISYTEFPEQELIPELVQAIAAGRAPDVVLFPAEELISEDDKLLTIPYESLSRREFQDTFVEAGEIFLYENGMKGLPFIIDPMVMYWNRTLFANAGISRPFSYWDEISQNASRLTAAQDNGTLTRSAVALGTWANVTHAKAVFVSLMRQLGNSVVVRTGGSLGVILKKGDGGEAAESALRFYTEFADPVKPVYSWNRSQPQAMDAFIAGKLAMYFGRASELQEIREANPNLNFDVAELPQARGGVIGSEARVVGLSVPRGATNPGGAFTLIQAFTGQSSQSYLSRALILPSVRRDLLSASPSNAYETVFQRSALTSFTFFDPEPARSDAVFARMVENVLSGRSQISTASADAHDELSVILNEVE